MNYTKAHFSEQIDRFHEYSSKPQNEIDEIEATCSELQANGTIDQLIKTKCLVFIPNELRITVSKPLGERGTVVDPYLVTSIKDNEPLILSNGKESTLRKTRAIKARAQ